LGSWPVPNDLLAQLGGWTDVLLAAALVPHLGPLPAYDLVLCGFVAVCGYGGQALARAMGASPLAGIFAGVLLQLDGWFLHHVVGGRPEQAGLGFVALALALALRAWDGGGWRTALACGVTGAIVVLTSWEHAILLALLMAVLTPFVVTERTPGGPKAWGIAAGTTAVLAGPWTAWFLVHAHGAGVLDPAGESSFPATTTSVGLLGWLAIGATRPALGVLLVLAVVPFLVDPAKRRRWMGLTAACAVCLVLALGPEPGFLRPGDLPWGPFELLRSVPILARYHWPDRLLAAFSLAGVAAAAWLFDHLRQRRARIGAVFAVILVADVLGEDLAQGLWPRGQLSLPSSSCLDALRTDTAPGAVIDLPPPRRGPNLAQVDQLVHRRAIVFGLPYQPAVLDRLRTDPFLRWFQELVGARVPPAERTFAPGDLRALVDDGFRFVLLRDDGLPPDRHALARRVVIGSLGDPITRDGGHLTCWRLP